MEWALKRYVYYVNSPSLSLTRVSLALLSLRENEGPLVVYYVFGYFDTIPDSFRATTKILPVSTSTVHTQEWLWRCDFCERAQRRCGELESGASRIG